MYCFSLKAYYLKYVLLCQTTNTGYYLSLGIILYSLFFFSLYYSTIINSNIYYYAWYLRNTQQNNYYLALLSPDVYYNN